MKYLVALAVFCVTKKFWVMPGIMLFMFLFVLAKSSMFCF